jgi:hypothetical protein
VMGDGLNERPQNYYLTVAVSRAAMLKLEDTCVVDRVARCSGRRATRTGSRRTGERQYAFSKLPEDTSADTIMDDEFGHSCALRTPHHLDATMTMIHS